MWVFDDDRVGLTKEPFVAGADKFIDYHLNKIEKLEEGKKGFNMVFSVIPFKDFDYEVEERDIVLLVTSKVIDNIPLNVINYLVNFATFNMATNKNWKPSEDK